MLRQLLVKAILEVKLRGLGLHWLQLDGHMLIVVEILPQAQLPKVPTPNLLPHTKSWGPPSRQSWTSLLRSWNEMRPWRNGFDLRSGSHDGFPAALPYDDPLQTPFASRLPTAQRNTDHNPLKQTFFKQPGSGHTSLPMTMTIPTTSLRKGRGAPISHRHTLSPAYTPSLLQGGARIHTSKPRFWNSIQDFRAKLHTSLRAQEEEEERTRKRKQNWPHAQHHILHSAYKEGKNKEKKRDETSSCGYTNLESPCIDKKNDTVTSDDEVMILYVTSRSEMRIPESSTTLMEGGTGVSGKGVFVCKKINCIRWKPRKDTSSLDGNLFVTGSWDDGPSNEVALWKVNEGEGESASLLASLPHSGDINALEFLNSETFVTGSSDGCVHLFRIHNQDLSLLNSWNGLHNGCYRASGSNSVSCSGEIFASAGEEGKVVVINARTKQSIKTYEQADSCSLSAVHFVKHDEILTANMRGQMKLWDLRSSETSSPSTTFFSSNTDQVGITCVSRHPTQSHVICTGGSGCAVSEVQFHLQSPDHIFSCSQNGDIWHWDASAVTRANLISFGNMNDDEAQKGFSSPWLSSEAIKHRVEATSLMSKQYLPINALDTLGSSILFAGDNEAIYIFSSVIL
ncbi:NUP43 [Lepeophtheirus salmonis]|uniref:NUP43 n=1 Tax=Lepeophtheirus salmonis TaxID=72036 RepID=A0A7R8HD34_LEPSM|nr:NUP43 [Lepeophtheirus salmonis]CAF3015484.1 NUP43 [Lepeophtheirus salmonis]